MICMSCWKYSYNSIMIYEMPKNSHAQKYNGLRRILHYHCWGPLRGPQRWPKLSSSWGYLAPPFIPHLPRDNVWRHFLVVATRGWVLQASSRSGTSMLLTFCKVQGSTHNKELSSSKCQQCWGYKSLSESRMRRNNGQGIGGQWLPHGPGNLKPWVTTASHTAGF